MSSLEIDTKFVLPPYRNALHDVPSYNYTIVLRVFDLEDLDKFEGDRYPEHWDNFEDSSLIVLAATGGTYNFKNRYGVAGQISDAFIENLTIDYNIGMAGFQNRATTGATTAELTIREPNGINFLPTLLASFLRANNAPSNDVVGTVVQFPLLLSIYFNPADGSENYLPNYGNLLSSKTRHLLVMINNAKFNITSSGTTYNLSLVEVGASAAYPSAQKVLFEGICTALTGITVGDYLRALIQKMNEEGKKLSAAGDDQHTYDYEYRLVFLEKQQALNFENSKLATTFDGSINPADSSMTLASIAGIAGISSPNIGVSTPYIPPEFEQVKDKIIVVEGGKVDNSKEPSAKTNYNVIYTGISPADRIKYFSRSLEDMTIAEILKAQDDILAAKSLSVPVAGGTTFSSPAVGAYQFVGRTLRSLAKAEELKEKFTGEVQDRLAKRLYERTRKSNVRLAATWAYFKYINPSGKDLVAQGARDARKFPFELPGQNGGVSEANRKTSAKQIFDRIKNRGYRSSEQTIVIAPGQTFESVVTLLLINSEYIASALKYDEGKGIASQVPVVKVYRNVAFGEPTDTNRLKQTITFTITSNELPAYTEGVGLADSAEVLAQVENATIREYNYLFTGKNIDILDLNLNFDNTVSTSNLPYLRLTETTASEDRDAVGAGQETPVDTSTPTNPNASVKGTGISSSTAYPASSSAGLPKSFRNVESVLKAAMPALFGFEKNTFGPPTDLINVDLEIVGDPDLMPTTETTLSADHLKRVYEKHLTEPEESAGVMSGFGPKFFKLVFGNPDTRSLGNSAYGGYYQFQTIKANFKESGAFTMQIKGIRDVRVHLVSKLTIDQNKQRQKDYETLRSQTDFAAQTQLEDTRNKIAENLRNTVLDLSPGVSDAITNAPLSNAINQGNT